VTGATGGIGTAVARALHGRGATVLLSGRRQAVLEELRASLGERAEIIAGDLAESDGAARLAEAAGAVDVLVANAALPASGRVEDFDPEQIDRALDVNLRAPIQLARQLMPGMVERRFGRLVFISSMAGKVANPYSSIYAATKFGLRGFALALHQDLAGSGVAVSAVFPGFIRDAGMFADSGTQLPSYVGTNTPDEVAQGVLKAIDSGRPEIDVAPVGVKLGGRLAGLMPAQIATLTRRVGGEKIARELGEGQREMR
jgi:uncharacterized protein